MELNMQFTNKIIKYLVYALIVYTLFAYVPQKVLPSSDIFIMTGIILSSFIILDLLTPSQLENFDIVEGLDDKVELIDVVKEMSQEEQIIIDGTRVLLKLSKSKGVNSLENGNEIILDTEYEFDNMYEDREDLVGIGTNKQGVKMISIPIKIMNYELVTNNDNLSIIMFGYKTKVKFYDLISEKILFEVIGKSQKIYDSKVLIDDEIEVDEEEEQEILDLSKPKILKELEDSGKLDANEVEEIIIECADTNNCNLRLKQLLNDGKINNQQLLELSVVFGLGEYAVIQELYLQERISREQMIVIAIAISSEQRSFVNSILMKYNKENIITEEDYNQIIKLLDVDSKTDMTPGETYVAEMIKNGEITTENAKIINDKCLSASLDSCSIQVNKLEDENILSKEQANAILRGYNKPNVRDKVDENDKFGAISNDSKVTSLNKANDLGDVKMKQKLLEDENMLKQAKSVAASRKEEIDKLKLESELLEKQNLELQQILDQKQEMERDLFQNRFANEVENQERMNKMHAQNYEDIQNLLDKKTSEKYDENNDMNYSIYTGDENVPLGTYSKDFNNSFNHGQSHLATFKWRPPQYDNSICKLDDHCDTCENDFEGYPVDVSKWNYTRKILPRDNINVNYLRDKLNHGKY